LINESGSLPGRRRRRRRRRLSQKLNVGVSIQLTVSVLSFYDIFQEDINSFKTGSIFYMP
jgi:hypothetical protein